MSSNRSGSGRAVVADDGFAEVYVPASEVHDVLDMMKARIRRKSHLEKSVPEDFAEVSRLARMCFLMSARPPGEGVSLGRLSAEDLESAYLLPHDSKSEGFLAGLNLVRGRARSTGFVDPETADRAAKSVYEVMGG